MAPKSILGPLGELLEPSWQPAGLLEPLGSLVEASWKRLGAILKPLGALLKPLGSVLEALGAVLEPKNLPKLTPKRIQIEVRKRFELKIAKPCVFFC